MYCTNLQQYNLQQYNLNAIAASPSDSGPLCLHNPLPPLQRELAPIYKICCRLLPLIAIAWLDPAADSINLPCKQIYSLFPSSRASL